MKHYSYTKMIETEHKIETEDRASVCDTRRSKDGDFVVRSSNCDYGGIDYIHSARGDGNSAYPTWFRFSVAGGQVSFMDGDGNEINTDTITVHFVGELEHVTVKDFIEGLYKAHFGT